MAMQRIPKAFLRNLQLTTSLVGATYTVPANSFDTIGACTLNNTTAVARLVTIHIVPSGATASTATQVATNLTVPPSGSSPTTVPALVGQQLEPGDSLQLAADVGAAVTPYASGYRTTL